MSLEAILISQLLSPAAFERRCGDSRDSVEQEEGGGGGGTAFQKKVKGLPQISGGIWGLAMRKATSCNCYEGGQEASYIVPSCQRGQEACDIAHTSRGM